ncbi:MAG: hypothetical protein A2Z97_07525 [Bdellovibrionales bacterium GWB1_52_6]|nr:MAG: hypothetical protein A2Z97_07525 [Bdellovibrionales bacterium GWB1_52_6]OFZ04815.1 MAG: hypothetical protein A2X97_13470 [Bdellovibrionales bacterium GWA1_52_35]
MKYTFFKGLQTVIMCCLMSSLASAAGLTAQQIVEKADLARSPGGSFSFQVRVSDFQNKKLLADSTYHVSSKGNDLTLVDTVEPARLRGRKLLMNGNNLWFIVPDVRRPTRVSLQQRLTGEVANGDIARVNFGSDYHARLLGSEVISGSDSYKLELTARTKEVTYSRLWYWVGKKDFLPKKATFFALSGKPLKNAYYKEFKPALGRSVLSKLVITDELRTDKISQLQYSGFRRRSFDEGFFNKESVAE